MAAAMGNRKAEAGDLAVKILVSGADAGVTNIGHWSPQAVDPRLLRHK
jgi:hypothetical protein